MVADKGVFQVEDALMYGHVYTLPLKRGEREREREREYVCVGYVKKFKECETIQTSVQNKIGLTQSRK